MALTLQQSLILSMHVATVERKNSLLTGRILQQNQAQCERRSAATDWGFDRTEQRHKENKEALIQETFLWTPGCSLFGSALSSPRQTGTAPALLLLQHQSVHQSRTPFFSLIHEQDPKISTGPQTEPPPALGCA
ncbi:hypothetical protein GOODEAATRI_029521 [Goodea atripinnis]|uniref:Uncharacterized protein n=1 Tax=Goodea atripinnis TaxID=208336 RepID=A0ABV0NP60_9TELE